MNWLDELIDFFSSILSGGGSGESTPTPTPSPSPTPTPTPRPTPVPSHFEGRTMPTFDQYEIPREVAYGIADAEGGKIGENNIYNIRAYDSNPQAALDFGSMEAAATAAAKLLSGQYQRSNGKTDTRYKDAYERRADPAEMLKLIMLAGFAGDPSTWKQRSAAQGGAGLKYDSWDSFVKDTPGWKKWSGNY